MNKFLFTLHVLLLTFFVSFNANAQEANKKDDNQKTKIAQQIKRVTEKVKQVETSTKEMLDVLKKLIAKKKSQSEDFLNREIK